ncbi:hypothetical protein SeLEV6574_g01142 [Synchytrium endobioticum]|uniref:Mitochondrial import inner membrane translocase subunit TIM54 n=1 Tax=Synchytrium endobioticum TaxID=286115 RepID=A0A507DFF6_9FUNG|nr:hypothetical protein SeLEV6574_g01142 [Synchytrium endobioticum]
MQRFTVLRVQKLPSQHDLRARVHEPPSRKYRETQGSAEKFKRQSVNAPEYREGFKSRPPISYRLSTAIANVETKSQEEDVQYETQILHGLGFQLANLQTSKVEGAERPAVMMDPTPREPNTLPSEPSLPKNPILRRLGWVTGYKLPSRNWMIFWSVLGTSVALYAYDRQERRKIAADLRRRAAPLAEVPMSPQEVPRKIWVYLAPSQFARYNFNEYTKPVFDAAALDYELIQTEDHCNILERVKNHIWTGKAEARGLSKQPRQPYNPYIPPPRPVYSSNEGLVAMGRGAWREVLNGINDACLSLSEDEVKAIEMAEQRKKVEELSSRRLYGRTSTTLHDKSLKTSDKTKNDEKTWYQWITGADRTSSKPLIDSATSPSIAEKTLPAPPADTSASEIEKTQTAPQVQLSIENLPLNFQLPPVGYISGQNLTGWTNFPLRVYHWFTSRNTASKIGEEALAIAYGATKSLELSDVEAVMKDIGEESLKEDGIHLEPFVREKMTVYT